jgi:hypothetical protein
MLHSCQLHTPRFNSSPTCSFPPATLAGPQLAKPRLPAKNRRGAVCTVHDDYEEEEEGAFTLSPLAIVLIIIVSSAPAKSRCSFLVKT